MTDDDDATIRIVTERFERRVAEETGTLRVDMATQFGNMRADMATEFGKVRADTATDFGKVRAEMATGFGSLRAEMIERNHELLKWALVFWATQIAAIAALLALFR